jgi:hypothetical protein
MTPTNADILARFDSYILDHPRVESMRTNRENFKDMAASVLSTTVPGREQSLAMTALEQAKFWTNQSIALGGLPDSTDGDMEELNILSQPIKQDDLPDTPTLGGYLAELLLTLLAEGEGFDPKRPFGNSDWEDRISDAIDEAEGPGDGHVLSWTDIRLAISGALTTKKGTAA